MLKMYKKVHKFADVTTYFSTHKWNFGNKNTSTLWEKLSTEDKNIFFFSMKDFDWDDFMEKCVRGLRLYIFKDDPGNVPMARKRMARYLYLLLLKLLKTANRTSSFRNMSINMCILCDNGLDDYNKTLSKKYKYLNY